MLSGKEGKPLPKETIRQRGKLALNLGMLAAWAGLITAHLALPGEQSVLRPIGYILFLAGVLFAILGLPKRSLANVMLILGLSLIPLVELLRPRWTAIILLMWYSLAIGVQVPKGHASLRRSFSHWKQTIKELNAASKL